MKPQFILSVMYLAAYFSMLAAILWVEVAPDIEVKTGDASMMTSFNLLMGVLTGGVYKIIDYWFTKGKDDE